MIAAKPYSPISSSQMSNPQHPLLAKNVDRRHCCKLSIHSYHLQCRLKLSHLYFINKAGKQCIAIPGLDFSHDLVQISFFILISRSCSEGPMHGKKGPGRPFCNKCISLCPVFHQLVKPFQPIRFQNLEFNHVELVCF